MVSLARSTWLCLLLVGLSTCYPVDDSPVRSEEIHEPVSASEAQLEKQKELEGVQIDLEQPSPPLKEEAPLPVSDEAHEPVYLNEGEKLPEPQEPSLVSEEDRIPLEESKEAVSSLESSFSRYDEDGDGYIDIFEWERKIEDELTKKKFKDADADADEKISQEEYQQWSAPVEPQENVNEVYVPSELISQPVDESLPPVGRSAAEDISVDQGRDVVGDLEPLVGAAEEQPAIALLPQEGAEPVLVEKILVEEVVPVQEGDKVVAILEETAQPAVVLLDDKKPEVVVPEVESVKPSVKSISDVEDVAVPVAEDQLVKKEEVLPESPAVVSEAVLPVKEESVAVESQSKPEEAVKVEESVIAVKSEAALSEVAEAEKKPEVIVEEKKEEVAQADKQPEVVAPQVQKLPEVAKLPVVVSEASKLPEVVSESLKKVEVSAEEVKPSNVIKP